ncbi:MAG: hypothetical protein EU531_06540 [Promethearchaeota archaeon]|nr:MAG: hypothetical protein EU531_06540 [Candidatus Lokiarchaeota archaeon]
MLNESAIGKIRDFIVQQKNKNTEVHSYHECEDDIKYFQKNKIGVELDTYKEVILQEETGLELGGMNKESFLLIYPLKEKNLLHDGTITIIGPEINDIQQTSIDFGLLLLISIKDQSNQKLKQLNSFTFISNSIEGFSIRSVPRRFWSRVSTQQLKKGFNFQFLAQAILYLYRIKFSDIVEAMEIIMINSCPDIIKNFLLVSSELTHKLKEKWLKKLEDWKKRIDCEYEWGCEICPYQVECYEIKKVLVARNKKEEI